MYTGPATFLFTLCKKKQTQTKEKEKVLNAETQIMRQWGHSASEIVKSYICINAYLLI